MRTILVDGDAVAWKISFLAATAADARANAARHVEKIAERLRAARAIVCLSDASRRYFRHELYPAYKAKSSPRPPLYADAVESLRAAYICREMPGLESDDVMGILATHPAIRGETVIVADDKDLLTVPGRHYRPRTREELLVEPAEADRRHMLQTLTGDGCDGYPGCRGVGPKRAAAIVGSATPAELWPNVLAAFVARGFTEADALTQARLARICRADDYDVTAGRVRPWVPPVDARKAG